MMASAKIAVTLVWSPCARQVHTLDLLLDQGTRVSQVLALLAGDARFADVPSGALMGVWNRIVDPSAILSEGDRIEIYRPLRVDPKVARRERFQKQGARSAGLFAQRRPGAKAGY